MNLYQPVKLTQALISSTIIFGLGLALMLISGLKLSLLGQLSWWSIPLGILAGASLYAAVYQLTELFLINSPSIRVLMEKLHSLFREFSWPAILLISLMAGLGEELLVRGVIQNWLVDATSPVTGILAASFIFGCMHFLSRAYVLITFALGLAFGWAYYASDSLLLVMLAHAVYDVLAFAVLVKYPHLLKLEKQN